MDTVKQLMQDLRNSETDQLRDTMVTRLLAVLKDHPELIYEKFYFNSNYMTALHALVHKKVEIKPIKALCDLAQDVRKLVGTKSKNIENLGKGDYPLHSAIRNGAPKDVLAFL